jgi:Zn-finger nucleic acid-binding protein
MELSETRGYFSCGHCGRFHFPGPAPDAVRIVGVEQRPPLCPTCRLPLAVATIANHPGHCCERCRGLLLSRETFVSVVQTRRAWATSAPVAPRPVDRSELEREVECPNCQSPMATHPYYGPGGIVIDTCGACDVIWLDARELDSVIDAPGRDRGTSFRASEGRWQETGEKPEAEGLVNPKRINLIDLLFGED